MLAMRQTLRKSRGRDFIGAGPGFGLTTAQSNSGCRDSGVQASGYGDSGKTLELVMCANQKAKTIFPAASISSRRTSKSAIDTTPQDSLPASDPPSRTLGVGSASPTFKTCPSFRRASGSREAKRPPFICLSIKVSIQTQARMTAESALRHRPGVAAGYTIVVSAFIVESGSKKPFDLVMFSPFRSRIV
jgi:hypothetical protein